VTALGSAADAGGAPVDDSTPVVLERFEWSGAAGKRGLAPQTRGQAPGVSPGSLKDAAAAD
jgi:hypothetical protein